MKKIMKKFLPVVLIISIILTTSFVAYAVESKNENSIKVQFYEDSGVLVVSGEGEVRELYENFYYDEETDEYVTNYDTSIKHIIIEEGITSIFLSFSRLKALKSITFPETLNNITGSFINCDSLEKVTFPSSLKTIDSASFHDCDAITDLYFNDGLEKISCYSSAFGNMDSLESVFIPSGTRLAGAFRNCVNLKTVIFEDNKISIKPYEPGEGTDDSTQERCFDNCHEDAVIYVGECRKNRHLNPLEECVSPDISVVYLESYPTKLNAAVGVNGIDISWDAHIPEKVYHLYRKAKGDTEWTKITDTNRADFTDTNVMSGKTYTYLLKADESNESVNSNSILYLSRPVLKSVVSTSSKTATVKWNKVDGADGYYVYRSETGEAGSWTRVAKIKSGDTTSYSATGLKKGSEYYFCVKAYSGKTASASSNKKVVTVGEPVITATHASNGKITVKWNKLSDVKYYRVYFKNKGVPAYTTVATIKNPSTVSYSGNWQFDSQNIACVRVRAFYKDGTHQISAPIEVKK